MYWLSPHPNFVVLALTPCLVGSFQDLSRGVRVYGSGPVVIRPNSITSYFKYDSASRQFKKLTTNAFTVTTDAISVAPSSQRSLSRVRSRLSVASDSSADGAAH